METLNSDEKMVILMKLTGLEIIKICETSKIMQKVCTEERYNVLWQQKIWEEFEIKFNGDRGCKKYKELALLYRKTFYIVNCIDIEHAGDSFSTLFDTREKAENYIYFQLAPEYTYTSVKTGLKINDSIQRGRLLYSIEQTHLEKQVIKQDISGLDLEYEKAQERFHNLYKNDKFANEIKHATNDIIRDINNDYAGISRLENVDRITEDVRYLAYEFEIVEKYKTHFIDYISDNIFVVNNL